MFGVLLIFFVKKMKKSVTIEKKYYLCKLKSLMYCLR